MIVVRQFGMYLLRTYWENRTYRTAVALAAVTSLVGLCQFILLGRFLQDGNSFGGIADYGGNIISFLLSGSVFTGFVAVSLGCFSGYLQSEQQMGTLESLAVAPVPLLRIMMFPGLAGVLGTTVSSVLMIFGFGFLFDLQFSVDVVSVGLLLALLVVTLGSVGLAGCGVLLVTKRGDPVTWTVTTLTTLLAGVLYPVSLLPQWLQVVSRLLPTTQALDGLRLAMLQAAPVEQILPILGMLAAWSAVLLPVGVLLLRRGLARARAEGTLGEL